MIKASELRLNNWVNITGTLIQLTGEKFLYILAEDGLITRCEGVPLTPEILEASGFEYNSGWNAFSKGIEHDGLGDYLLGIDMENNVSFVTQFSIHDGAGYFPCKHVHQLQNLYFALTGEELQISVQPYNN